MPYTCSSKLYFIIFYPSFFFFSKTTSASNFHSNFFIYLFFIFGKTSFHQQIHFEKGKMPYTAQVNYIIFSYPSFFFFFINNFSKQLLVFHSIFLFLNFGKTSFLFGRTQEGTAHQLIANQLVFSERDKVFYSI